MVHFSAVFVVLQTTAVTSVSFIHHQIINFTNQAETISTNTSWPQFGESEMRCIGQAHRFSDVDSKGACQELAISRKHPYYQYNQRKIKCATIATCDNPIAHDGWVVFRQEGLWPPEGDRGFKCTGKKKASALANSQMDCQLVAESRSHMHYQYHSKLSKCATSANCRNPIYGGNWRVFSKPSRKTPVERIGQLKVVGNSIVSETGTPVQLRGMSFFWSQWSEKYWNTDVVTWLATDWKVDVLRAAMGVEDGGGYIENAALNEELVHTVVGKAIEEGIYVIIDWHSHHAEDNVEEAKTFFAKMAEQYGKYPNVLFEIYNEPTTQSWSDTIKPYSETLVETIRQHSQNIIILGSSTWSQDVDVACADPVSGDNLAYTLHFYAAFHRQSLRDKAQAALDKGCALFVTEWGTCGATGNGTLDFDETKLWTDFLDVNHISSTNWAVNDKYEACSALQPGASVGGGWKPEASDDLTWSGLWTRNYIRGNAQKVSCDAPAWPCVAPECSDNNNECLGTECCSGAGYTCFAKDEGWAQCMNSCGGAGQEDWSCDPLSEVKPTTAPTCANDVESCAAAKCCQDAGKTCFQKDEYWAACRESCTPGIWYQDPPEYQTPWSCKELTPAKPTAAPTCANDGESCAAAKCCQDAGKTCVQKDEYWATCRESCTPGIWDQDPPEYQTPWSCKELTPTDVQ